MFLTRTRRRLLEQREKAAPARLAAAVAFAEALKDAEAALDAMREANNDFYRSDQPAENALLGSLRRERERTFVLHAKHQIAVEAPLLARLLGLRFGPKLSKGLPDWVAHVNALDLTAISADPGAKQGEAA